MLIVKLSIRAEILHNTHCLGASQAEKKSNYQAIATELSHSENAISFLDQHDKGTRVGPLNRYTATPPLTRCSPSRRQSRRDSLQSTKKRNDGFQGVIINLTEISPADVVFGPQSSLQESNSGLQLPYVWLI